MAIVRILRKYACGDEFQLRASDVVEVLKFEGVTATESEVSSLLWKWRVSLTRRSSGIYWVLTPSALAEIEERLRKAILPMQDSSHGVSTAQPFTERRNDCRHRSEVIVTQRPDEESQPRHIAPNRTKLSEVDWQRYAAAFNDREAAWTADAIKRLKNGDVSSTRHGIRVQVRGDLGEYRRFGAAAFWPKENDYGIPDCACSEMWGLGMCGHVAAARMYRRWLEERQSSGRKE
jgi:hypothetical protein